MGKQNTGADWAHFRFKTTHFKWAQPFSTILLPLPSCACFPLSEIIMSQYVLLHQAYLFVGHVCTLSCLIYIPLIKQKPPPQTLFLHQKISNTCPMFSSSEGKKINTVKCEICILFIYLSLPPKNKIKCKIWSNPLWLFQWLPMPPTIKLEPFALVYKDFHDLKSFFLSSFISCFYLFHCALEKIRLLANPWTSEFLPCRPCTFCSSAWCTPSSNSPVAFSLIPIYSNLLKSYLL